MTSPSHPGWLLLIHQIPPKPGYLRVKIGRRLQGLGALAVKNSVYVLPATEACFEDFQWVRREIVAGKGEAWVCEARFVEGFNDAELKALFSAARESDYESLLRQARQFKTGLERAKKITPARAAQTTKSLVRLKKRLVEVRGIDFFAAEGAGAVEGVLAAIESRLRDRDAPRTASGESPPRSVSGATWVTRAGVHVDRIASAWLIRRFIDPEARFKLVSGKDYKPVKGELRFDMFDGEFTHEGDLCTFEALIERFSLADPALRRIAEVVHDIDLKEARFAAPETPGVERLIAGIGSLHETDDERLRLGGEVFEALYAAFGGGSRT